jgi:hypothetical protein
MASVPTIKVTDGKTTVTINVSDQSEWKDRGFLPEKAVPAKTKKT